MSFLSFTDDNKLTIRNRTGFDVSFRPQWNQVGRHGRSLAEEWEVDSKAYFSLCASGYPNHFIFNGPCGPVGHGSLSSAIDWEAEYILKWVDKVAREGIKYAQRRLQGIFKSSANISARSFDVKQEVQDEWNTYGDEILKRTVWTSGCNSWYKNRKTDRVSALYPGSILHFVRFPSYPPRCLLTAW